MLRIRVQLHFVMHFIKNYYSDSGPTVAYGGAIIIN